MDPVECGCGQVFMGEGEPACPECMAAAGRLVCVSCGTQMLVEVPSQTCGICDPAWSEQQAVAV